jgi:hypothetical protein
VRRIALGLSLAAVALPAAAPARAAGPPLGVPEHQLASALRCAGDLAGAARAPVLLVHGTGSTVEESWRSGYLYALSEVEKIPTCAVQLPDRAMEDIQIASEYVVHAVRRMARASGRRIAVVGHSQGGVEPMWALRFWPDVPPLVEDLVAMATPYNGTASANGRCGSACQPSVWQQRQGSRLLGAIARQPAPAGPSYTSIATLYDAVVQPQPEASRLPGARNVVLQDICPNRPVDHLNMLYDNLTYSLVLDALRHAGPADPSRLPEGICQTTSIPVDSRTYGQDVALGVANVVGAFTIYREVDEEPALFCYADPASSRGVATYCPAGSTRTVARRRAASAPMRVAVAPRTVPTGCRVRVRFRVTGRRGRPVAGATIRFAGRRARTDRRGRATLTVRFVRPGVRGARVTRRGHRAAVARVRAIAPRR